MGARHKGFTLVELMIAVTLVAVLAILLYPVLTGFTSGHDSQVGMNGMVDFMHRARVQASLTGRAHQVRLTHAVNGELWLDQSATSSCCCAGAPGDPFLVSNGGTPAVDTYDLGNFAPGLKVEASDPPSLFDSAGVCFTPDGRVLDTYTLQPFAPEHFAVGTAAFELKEHDVDFVAAKPQPGAAVLPGRHWFVLVSYNGQAHWEAAP